MARSVADALASVDPAVRQSATAVGYGGVAALLGGRVPARRARCVLAGLRVAAVSTISLVTVGILIGVESLGYLFTNGYQRSIIAEILAGVVADVVDRARRSTRCSCSLGRVLMPWAPRRARAPADRARARPVDRGRRPHEPLRRRPRLALLARPPRPAAFRCRCAIGAAPALHLRVACSSPRSSRSRSATYIGHTGQRPASSRSAISGAARARAVVRPDPAARARDRRDCRSRSRRSSRSCCSRSRRSSPAPTPGSRRSTAAPSTPRAPSA